MVCTELGNTNLGSRLLICSRMSGVCESWDLEELVNMTDEDMDALLTYYKSGTVPTFDEIHAPEYVEPAFDGSFGWW